MPGSEWHFVPHPDEEECVCVVQESLSSHFMKKMLNYSDQKCLDVFAESLNL